MKGYEVTVTCPQCGGQVEPVAGGLPRRTSTSAIFRCTECGHLWQLMANLLRVETTEAQRKAAAKQRKKASV